MTARALVIEYARFSQGRAKCALFVGLPIAIVFSMLLIHFAQVDLSLSALFFRDKTTGYVGEASQFWLSHSHVLHVLYDAVFMLSRVALAISVLTLLVYLITKNAKAFLALVVCASLLAGPMFAVNAVVKEHWGRARPRDVVQFESTQQFTPAWVISNQCAHNCSFTSGHAAAGFAICIGYFVSRRKIWLNGGLIVGSIVGLTRMMNGAHFFSDVVFSFFIVFLTAALMTWLISTLTLKVINKKHFD